MQQQCMCNRHTSHASSSTLIKHLQMTIVNKYWSTIIFLLASVNHLINNLAINPCGDEGQLAIASRFFFSFSETDGAWARLVPLPSVLGIFRPAENCVALPVFGWGG